MWINSIFHMECRIYGHFHNLNGCIFVVLGVCLLLVQFGPETFPKGPCFEVPRLWRHCRLMKALRGKAQWEDVGSLGHTLDWHTDFILPFSLLASMTWAASSVVLPCYGVWSLCGLKQRGQQQRLRTLKSQTQTLLISSWVCYLSSSHSNRNLSNTALSADINIHGTTI